MITEAPASAPAGVSTHPRRQASVSRRRVAVVAVVLLGAMGFLLYKGITSAVVYFKTVPEALAARASLGNSTFQLEGLVAAGTISHAPGSSTTAFVLSSGGARIAVQSTGVPPQLFQADVPVVVVGHFVGHTDRFLSDQILVKHSNQYIAAHPARVRAPNGSVR